MKLLVFTEGTLLIHKAWAGLSREEMVQRNKATLDANDFAASVPVGNAVTKLQTWQRQGAEISYLTSRTKPNEIDEVRASLTRFGFPEGQLWFRQPGEGYKDVAEKVRPDVLIEDDCESIGGEIEMTYPHLRTDFKTRLGSIVVKEFGGIDHLPDSLSDLAGH